LVSLSPASSIKSEKDYDGVFPFVILAYVTTVCMVSSETVAKIVRLYKH
jgi:hypothetical protein